MMAGTADKKPAGKGIGTLRETSLHAALKDYYAQAGDQLEVPIEGYLIDIVRGSELIEIQTGNFGSLKAKLTVLLADYQVRVVYPIAQERWIRRVSSEGEVVSRRKSPKRGRVEDVFNELVYVSTFLGRANLTMELLLLQDEITWLDDGRGSWRRKGWSVADRRLLAVHRAEIFNGPADYLALLPEDLRDGFTNSELAETLRLPRRLAQKMSYCLRSMGLIDQDGKKGRSYLYRVR